MAKGKGTVTSSNTADSPVGLSFRIYSNKAWLPDPTFIAEEEAGDADSGALASERPRDEL